MQIQLEKANIKLIDELSKEKLIKMFDLGHTIKTTQFPSDNYETRFYDLLEASAINNERLKLFALRALLEADYCERIGGEIRALFTAISNNRLKNNEPIFNEYIKAVWLDVNKISKYAVHNKNKSVDKKLINLLIELFIMYFSVAYSVDTIEKNKEILRKNDGKWQRYGIKPFSEQEINKRAIAMKFDEDSVAFVYVFYNTLSPYLSDLPNVSDF